MKEEKVTWQLLFFVHKEKEKENDTILNEDDRALVVVAFLSCKENPDQCISSQTIIKPIRYLLSWLNTFYFVGQHVIVFIYCLFCLIYPCLSPVFFL